jgi:hypothetical protein
MNKKPSSRVPDLATLGPASTPLVDRDYPHFNKKKVVIGLVVTLIVLSLILLLLIWQSPVLSP